MPYCTGTVAFFPIPTMILVVVELKKCPASVRSERGGPGIFERILLMKCRLHYEGIYALCILSTGTEIPDTFGMRNVATTLCLLILLVHIQYTTSTYSTRVFW